MVTASVSEIRTKVLQTLAGVRMRQGFSNENLTGSTTPLSLKRFDSQMGLVTSMRIRLELGYKIPTKVNVFVSEDGKKAITVDETAKLIHKLIQNN